MSGGRLPAVPALARIRSEDAPVRWAALSHRQSRATFQGVPASSLPNRGSPSSFLPHQQKANEPDNDEQDIACRIYSGSIRKRLLSVSPPRREASSQAIVSQRSASRPPRQPSHGNNAMRARSGQVLRQMAFACESSRKYLQHHICNTRCVACCSTAAGAQDALKPAKPRGSASRALDATERILPLEK